MTLRVLHVIPSIADCRGGPSKAVIEMVKVLNTKGVQAEITTTNDNGSSLLDVPLNSLHEYRGAPVRFFARFTSSFPALSEFQYSSGFRRWLNKHINDYDLIHVHAIFSFCSSYTMWLARRNKIPYIVRPIGQLEDWSLAQSRLKKQLYLQLLEWKNLENAAALHCTAESEQRQSLKLLNNQQTAVLPLGIHPIEPIKNAAGELRSKYAIKDGRPILVFLSRIHKKKGLELLLQSLAEINSPFQFLIAGDGDKDYLAEINKQIDHLELRPKVKLLGFSSGRNKNLLLQGADLYTLTSYSENFGIAVLEALNAGTPVLISEQVALADALVRKNFAYVCQTNVQSIKSELLRAFDRLSADSQDSSDAIQEFIASNYQWSAIADKLVRLYESVTQR